MIRPYIANLQIRLQTIQSCIGGVQNYKQQNIIQVRNKTKQFITKLHKETRQKFEKIKKTIQKYGDILDASTSSKQKLQIVTQQLEQLKQITIHLDTIQKYLPALNTSAYTQIRNQGENVDILMTLSDISEGDTKNSLKINKFDDKSLIDVRNEQREEMNQLLELNKRIINNLNSKLEALIKKAGK